MNKLLISVLIVAGLGWWLFGSVNQIVAEGLRYVWGAFVLYLIFSYLMPKQYRFARK